MDHLIKHYHDLKYEHLQILCALAKHHGISISNSKLKSILKMLKLKKYKIESPLELIIEKILDEFKGTGQLLGYRSMWRRLNITHKLNVKRQTVADLLGILDPEGVLMRKRKKLRRRKYSVPGPNHLWHLDGYDKLKPYGIPIHGCIDGFSRKIIWLKVCYSNNNPHVIANFYLNSLIERNTIPKILRADYGTENSLLRGIQPFLRESHSDSLSGIKSFMYGKSTSNQRIERFWGHVGRSCADFYRNLFKDLMDEQVLNIKEPLHTDCIFFCFSELIQNDLNKVSLEWDCHRIRKQKIDGKFGRPDILYTQCEAYGGEECGQQIDIDSINTCKEIYCENLETAQYSAFKEIVNNLMPDIVKPENPEQAVELFKNIINAIEEYI